MSSAILYFAIVAIWAGILMPRWLRPSAHRHRAEEAPHETAEVLATFAQKWRLRLVPGQAGPPTLVVGHANHAEGKAELRNFAYLERNQLDKIRLDEAQELSTYSWLDENSGTVRIPIDRAMDLIAERGLPVRGQVTTNTAQAPSTAPGTSMKGKKQ